MSRNEVLGADMRSCRGGEEKGEKAPASWNPARRVDCSASGKKRNRVQVVVDSGCFSEVDA